MRKAILFFAGIIALASCTQKYTPVPDPEVKEGGQYLFTANIAALPWADAYVWNAKKDIVGIYAGNESNCKYVLRNSCDGKSGDVEIYGPEVSGDAYAYFPYTADGVSSLEEGRIIIPSQQHYCTSTAELIQTHSTLVGACSDGKVTLCYMAGVLCVNLKVDFEHNVNEVILSCKQDICGRLDISGKAQERMTEASNTITLTGIDQPCSEASPLQLRFMLPEGDYTEIFVTANSSDESVMAAIKSAQPIHIALCRETVADAEVSAEEHDYSGSDFEEEPVHFD